jgi:hypothetical protein
VKVDIATTKLQILDLYNWFRPKGSPITLWLGQWLIEYSQLRLIDVLQERNSTEMEERSKICKERKQEQGKKFNWLSNKHEFNVLSLVPEKECKRKHWLNWWTWPITFDSWHKSKLSNFSLISLSFLFTVTRVWGCVCALNCSIQSCGSSTSLFCLISNSIYTGFT